MKVYKLLHDNNHSGDSEKDGFLLKYDGWNLLPYQLIDPKIPVEKLPSQIHFQANFNVIPKYDYPVTDVGVSVMSVKMYDTLDGIGNVNMDILPVVMLDDTYLGGVQTQNGSIKNDVPRLNSYVVVKVKKFLEGVFDYENSDYKMSRRIEGQIGRIRKIVLKESQIGFPPLFRIAETASTLFISQAAKEALESAGIKGCVYEEIEVS